MKTIPADAPRRANRSMVALSPDILKEIKLIEGKNDKKEQKIKYILNKHLRNPEFDKKIYFCIATRLFRMGTNTSLCAICLDQKEKEERRLKGNAREHPMCHVFPRSLLDVYKQIHCPHHPDEFIYNSYSEDDNKFVSIHKLAFPLFCQVCDNDASEEENFLKTKYTDIMEAGGKCLSITREDSEKLKHVLALIMFRGILLGIDFLEENDLRFYRIFEDLRQYVSQFSKDYSDYQKHQISKDFHIFILPNVCFNSENRLSTYIIDLQLHNPQFTTVVKADNGSKYLYMKFDIFHCVLAIETSSSPDVLQKSCFHANETSYSIPIGNEGIQLLPEFLMTYNMNRVKVLAWQLGMLKKSCMLYIQDPTQDYSTFEIPKLPSVIERDAKFAVARALSPLAIAAIQNHMSLELSRKCQKLENDSKTFQSNFDKAKCNFSKFRSTCAKNHPQWHKLKDQLDDLTLEYDKLKQEKDELEIMVKRLEGKHRELQQDFDQCNQNIQRLGISYNLPWGPEDTLELHVPDNEEQEQNEANFPIYNSQK